MQCTTGRSRGREGSFQPRILSTRQKRGHWTPYSFTPASCQYKLPSSNQYPSHIANCLIYRIAPWLAPPRSTTLKNGSFLHVRRLHLVPRTTRQMNRKCLRSVCCVFPPSLGCRLRSARLLINSETASLRVTTRADRAKTWGSSSTSTNHAKNPNLHLHCPGSR